MAKKPRFIAFYLPQFHPFKENDEWWGKGFTEWTNVGKAKPLFKGHDQPRVPTELGYYDLRMPEVREAQAQMAREAGVEGFMYWHYWFGNGKTLLANIFKEVLESGKPDFPFCLGWANHSWFAKNWNGANAISEKLLIEQTYPGEEDARLYFESLLPAFKDKRYIKVDGKPFFYIFDPVKLPISYIEWFRKWIVEAGLPGIFIVANVQREFIPKEEFISKGYDAVSYRKGFAGIYKSGYVSGNRLIRGWKKGLKLLKGWTTHTPPFMTQYKDAAKLFCADMEKEIDVIPTIMPQWDHTPRSGWNGTFMVNAEPKYFKEVAKKAIETVADKPEEHQIIFLKSWNEWGEGNYMEPDITHGRGYIEALREAIDEETKEQ